MMLLFNGNTLLIAAAAAVPAGLLPELRLGPVMYIVLGSATALKLLCWAVCAALQSKSDSMLALAEVSGMLGGDCVN
jgi:hypothetical protein